MDWCRLWHDAPDDPKWRLIARKAGCRSGDVWAVWCRMLVCASKHEPRGTIHGWDDETEAVALDYDTETVTAIREAMQGRVLEGYALAGWERRNPKREDNSADRVKAYRERQVAGKSVSSDGVTQCNAAKRTVTLDKIREDTDTNSHRAEHNNTAALARDVHDRCCEVIGVDPAKDPAWVTTNDIQAWIAGGADPERDILPAVRDAVAKRRQNDPGWRPGSMRYFAKPVSDWKGTLDRGLPPPSSGAGPPPAAMDAASLQARLDQIKGAA